MRSSWLALDTNARSRSAERSSRSSISLSVPPSSASSSRPGGTGSRLPLPSREISAASRRIALTGRSAAVATP